MKKTTLFTVLTLVFAMTSCEKDFLESSPLSQASEGTFWKTAEDAKVGLNAVYTILPTSRDFWRDCESDNSVMTNAWGEGGLGYISQGIHSATDGYINEEWGYGDLRVVLYYIDRLKGINMDATLKKQYDAEARFVLALKYFRMVQHFGDIPLIKEKPLDVADASIPRSPKQEVLDYALLNVETAIAGLPNSYTGEDTGRIDKAAALMLKANIYLYEASYKKFHGGTNDNALWAAAAAAANQVTTMGYSLVPNFSSIFLQGANNNNPEVILAYQYVQDKNTHFLPLLCSPNGVGLTGGGWASFCPTRDLIDSFECTDGKSIQTSALYDVNDPFTNRDKRLRQTFMLPGVPVLRPNGTMQPYQPHPSFNNPEKMNVEGGGLTGYMYLKFNDLTLLSPDRSYCNWPIYRYAETLLVLAEALNESTPTDPKIVWAVDQVRLRSGLPSVAASLGDQAKMRNIIREERRHEFVAEHKRYFDILRWKIAEDVLSKPAYGINSNISDPIGDWTKPKFLAQNRTFDPNKHYLWPIPKGAIDRNVKLQGKQNPGWN